MSSPTIIDPEISWSRKLELIRQIVPTETEVDIIKHRVGSVTHHQFEAHSVNIYIREVSPVVIVTHSPTGYGESEEDAVEDLWQKLRKTKFVVGGPGKTSGVHTMDYVSSGPSSNRYLLRFFTFDPKSQLWIETYTENHESPILRSPV